MSRLVDSSNIKSASLLKKLPPYRWLVSVPFVAPYALALYNVLLGPEDNFYYGLPLLALTILVHALAGLGCLWSVDIDAFVRYSSVSTVDKADFIKIVPKSHKGKKLICPLSKQGGKDVFYFHQVKYVHSGDSFAEPHFPMDLKMRDYKTAAGITSAQATDLSLQFGENRYDIPVPEFKELFKDHMVAPFFVFQMFCVLLWLMDEYWYYSLVTMVMLFVFEITVVKQRLRNLLDIHNMAKKPISQLYAYRDKKWTIVDSDALVPGDVCSLTRNKAQIAIPADMIVLRGSCVVDEAMLTGESVPQIKDSIETRPDTAELSEVEDRRHIVYAGTKVVQTSLPKDMPVRPPDNGCIAYVVRTGFSTSQGDLIRTILFSTERVSAASAESIVFILVLMVFAICASAYVLMKGLEDETRSRYKLFLNCTMIITSVVPPELPMELHLAVNTSLIALYRMAIFCSEPFRIPFAGKVDICCFDKTGTLTTDKFNVEGIVTGAKPDEPFLDPARATDEAKFVIAGCHSLVYHQGRLVGDQMEKAAMDAINWSSQGDVSRSIGRSGGTGMEVNILQRFPFSSALKRMSSVVTLGHVSHNTFHVVSKGAPEVMAGMFKNLPASYEETYKKHAIAGGRVLALGHKVLPSMPRDRIKTLPRDEVESDLQFDGFLVFTSPLKDDATETISQLLQSSHHVCMITGDQPLTACHVAKEVGIVQNKTMILERDEKSADQWQWRSLDGKECFVLNAKSVAKEAKEHDFVLTGDGVAHLQSQRNFGVFAHVKVFARTSPDQKESILSILKKRGFHTLMCGDGTNDVGALKQAHCGIALLEKTVSEALEGPASASAVDPKRKAKTPPPRPSQPAAKPGAQKKGVMGAFTMDEMHDEAPMVQLGDASIAAPFTSRSPDVKAAVNVIRQGRCTLVTTMQMFKILALNSLVSAYAMSVLFLDGVKLGDTQAMISALAMAMFFLFVSRATPLDSLSKKRPPHTIFSAYFLVSVFAQFAIHMYLLISMSMAADPHTPVKERGDIHGDFEPNIVNTVVYLVSSWTMGATFAANYRGRPFMQGMMENKLFFRSVVGWCVLILILASGFVGELNFLFELTPLPGELRNQLVVLMLADIAGVFMVEQVCQLLFERNSSVSK